MKSTTVLYRVYRPNHGQYFGIFDPATRRMRTERTEQAAAAVADEMGLRLEGEQEVTHDQWLRLTGVITEEEITAEEASRQTLATLGQPPKAAPAAPQPAPARFIDLSGDAPDALIIQRDQPFVFFATENLPTEHDQPNSPFDG